MWTYKGEEVNDLSSYVGFVYKITNLTDGRMYIGKKLATASKTKVVKGKKKRVRVESDWRDYYGSSEELKADVKELGVENFKREILRFCYSKTECNYYELKEQIVNDVLFHPELYYNGYIGTRISRKHVFSMLNQKGFKMT